MKPIRDLPTHLCNDVLAVLFDIDDTITIDGQLPAIAYQAVERLAKSGRRVVAVTGRPAGWCDMIARFWPVDAVIGENGAFYFRYDHARRKMTREYWQEDDVRIANRRRLQEAFDDLKLSFRDLTLARDQAYRDCDIAIDFREDVDPLTLDDAERIRAHFAAAGAKAKVSSIHVNAWFGDHDKLSMAHKLFDQAFDMSLAACRDRIIYVGDSPNDEPMFAYFPNAVGVANVSTYLRLLSHPPTWVTRGKGGYGFAELADHLLGTQ